MKVLRTISTRRLLALIAGFVSAIAAGAAIAVAAAGSGPVPPPKALPKAIRSALAARAPTGITARISFTNHLIDSNNIEGSDPILTGATGRLWLSSNHQLRLELQSDSGNGDAQVVVNNRSFWVYDPTAHTVYKGTFPADSNGAKHAKGHDHGLPSVAQIQKHLTELANRVNLTGAIPGDVAGHSAYSIRISPKHDGGLLGAGELAWDAVKGVPLRIAVYAQNDSSPVLELKATDISYGNVSSSAFNVAPPSGTKVVRVDSGKTHASAASHAKRLHNRRQPDVTGVSAVAKKLPFTLVAPKTLVGLPRRDVTRLSWGGQPAALVSYGQNLGGVAVIEQPTSSASKTFGMGNSGNGRDHRGLTLPTVSIRGVTGQELDTALGTVVRFTRRGVTYTVLGSVPAAAADAAARAL
jgi:outer membrane lipoprotein-sorting protein